MALPSSGAIGLDAIYTELTPGSQRPGAGISLERASSGTYAAINPNSAHKPNEVAPFSISSWYSYDQTASAAYSYTFGDGPFPFPGRACAFGPGIGTQTLFSADSAITSGTILYTDQGLTSNFDGMSQWWWSNDNITYQIDSGGSVNQLFTCI